MQALMIVRRFVKALAAAKALPNLEGLREVILAAVVQVAVGIVAEAMIHRTVEVAIRRVVMEVLLAVRVAPVVVAVISFYPSRCCCTVLRQLSNKKFIGNSRHAKG